MLNSTKKVHITNTPVRQTKSVRKESVRREADGKGIKKAVVREFSEKAKSSSSLFSPRGPTPSPAEPLHPAAIDKIPPTPLQGSGGLTRSVGYCRVPLGLAINESGP